ncbi:MAG: pectate lyase, partial [Prevotella sp.]|nr:pectate lyase [Prevotella sp.]
MNKRILIFVIAVIATTCVMAQHRAQNPMRQTDAAFFKTKEALQIGEQILLYQRVTGGWPKNINMAKPLTDAEKAQVLEDKQRRNDSTTDNNATSMQMAYLARLYEATKDPRFRDAFQQAVEYLLSGQYENGGWPQFWPEMRDYQIHITFNDDAMVNTMNLLNLIAQSEAPYSAELTTPELRQRAIKAFNKGVECILKTQIRKNGKLTVWCQQHDRDTYEPAPARAYELPSYCSQESVNIVKLLISLPKPDKRVKAAIHAAMQWFANSKLPGLRGERTGQW